MSTKRQTVRAMYAARECIARLRDGRHLPTDLLSYVVSATGDDTGRLSRLPQSAFCAPTGMVKLPNGDVIAQADYAIDVLEDFVDDCRLMLSEHGKASARG